MNSVLPGCRSEITIVVGKVRANPRVIVPGRKFVLRRSADAWVGQYFHARIRLGTLARGAQMMFACGSGGCNDGR
jgi:hypothetical protein